MITATAFQEALRLECLVPPLRDQWDIRTTDVNRPGMQLCGFYEHFAFERPQVIGKVEMSYLEQQSPTARQEILDRYFSYRLPCVIICRGMEPPPELLEAARTHQIALYRTQEVTTKLCANVLHYLNHELAPHITCHGDLLDVFGVGVLLTGKSGVGKSEAALELVKRGHQLVADDVVDVCRIAEDRLIGSSPDRIRHFMEIRGLGILDIRALYGIGAVALRKSIDLILELEVWDENKDYDRVGLQDHTTEIMGVTVPWQVVPVGPGRNLAVIIEVAARNFSAKHMGYNSVREFLSGIPDLTDQD